MPDPGGGFPPLIGAGSIDPRNTGSTCALSPGCVRVRTLDGPASNARAGREAPRSSGSCLPTSSKNSRSRSAACVSMSVVTLKLRSSASRRLRYVRTLPATDSSTARASPTQSQGMMAAEVGALESISIIMVSINDLATHASAAGIMLRISVMPTRPIKNPGASSHVRRRTHRMLRARARNPDLRKPDLSCAHRIDRSVARVHGRPWHPVIAAP